MSIVPYLYDVERPLRMMERDFFRSPLELVPRNFFGPQFARPWENIMQEWDNILRPVQQLSRAKDQLALNQIEPKITSDDEKFQVYVDVQHFGPEEISVKVVKGNVIIEGNHKEKQDRHGFISRQFVRRYALPKGPFYLIP
ncbi:unnamed protein product [Parnassius apollo]|uniref:(apollo) hypothetical protein n=1 Tax=Parnassius apollo TaxID=110799 RepID=A0A8S3WKA9_PARAO|nr:unnamed protein product [Parnassius apollo]